MEPGGSQRPDDDLAPRLQALQARLPSLERTLELLAASHKELRDRFDEIARAARRRLGASPAATLARLDQELELLRRQVLRLIGGLPHRLAAGPPAAG